MIRILIYILMTLAHGKQAFANAAPTTDQEAIKRVLGVFHHAIDGEAAPDEVSLKQILGELKKLETYQLWYIDLNNAQTWREWKENLNPRKIINYAQVAYNIESQHPITKKHAENLLLVFPISHGIEMASPFVFLALSQYLDLSAATVAGTTATLSLLSIPGLDVLCIAIFLSYPLDPVNKTITHIRAPIDFLIQQIRQQLNLLKTPDSFFHRVQNSLNKTNAFYSTTVLKNKIQHIVNFRSSDTAEFVNLEFTEIFDKYGDTERVELSGIERSFRSHRLDDSVTEFLKTLGGNRFIFKKTSDWLSRSTPVDEFFVRETIEHKNSLRWNFESHALIVKNEMGWKSSCKNLFTR